MAVTFERRTQIIDYLRESPRVSTRELGIQFAVSEVTIRHDLDILEREGWITRVHGGAELIPRLQLEQSYKERETLNLVAKIRIARAASALIREGDTILIDSSTTAFQLTACLNDFKHLTVITNHFHVARVLSPMSNIDLLLLGGTVRSETWSIVGSLAEETARGLHARLGFFGAAGITLERGSMDADIREVGVKRAMASAAQHIVLLADSSKFGRESLRTAIEFSHIAHLFTDKQLEANYINELNQTTINWTQV